MTEPYYACERVTLHHGDCLAALQAMPDNSVDAIVTDPPYGLSNTTPDKVADTIVRWANGERDHVPEGRGFMGRPWDAFVPPPAVWDECLRVLKPGGHMLVFAGSRTQDLMGLSIRLAGFELRDSLAWIYGSGMPKSHDVSKAIDKAAGAEREVVGQYVRRGDKKPYPVNSSSEIEFNNPTSKGNVTAPATPEAERWEGWGTALKPGFEPVIVASKPLGNDGLLQGIGSQLAVLNEVCRQHAKLAESSSGHTPADSSGAKTDSAHASAATPQEVAAASRTQTGAEGGSLDQTGTSASELTAETFLSTVTSWNNCWAALSELTSTSTTSTTTGLTTDLKTLKSSMSSLTERCTDLSETTLSGLTSIVSAVDSLFAVPLLRLNATRELSAVESATGDTPTSRRVETGQEENRSEPIILARKPLDGTVAANVLAHGVGGLNIDACRVATDWSTDPTRRGWQGRNLASESGVPFVDHNKAESQPNPSGRFPANVLLDEHAAQEMDRQSGVSVSNVRLNVKKDYTSSQSLTPDSGKGGDRGHADSGGASRFFPVFKYQAKAPKRERPVIEREDGTKVQHPTVKPLKLMEWITTLITPPGGTVLDPFAGSGTTLEAARDKGFRAVGIEADAEHCELIVARLEKGDGGLFAA